MSVLSKAALMLAASAFFTSVTATPLERQLDFQLSVDAKQSWRNDAQWSQATTRQRYDWSTRLRSDGKLYIDNLLEPDPKRSGAIRNNYQLYQGLLQLKQENEGKLPSPDQVSTQISTEKLIENPECFLGGESCPKATPERTLAVTALRKTTKADLEKLIQSYDVTGGQWLYFTGYIGCSNRIKLNYRSHFAGERIFNDQKNAIQAFDIDWTANTKGKLQEQKHLCQRYVATLNSVSGEFYIENVFVPSPRGNSVRTINGEAERGEVDLPPPYEVLQWADGLLKKAAASGQQQQPALHLSKSLDGDTSATGIFDGTAKVSLTWSFSDTPAPAEQ